MPHPPPRKQDNARGMDYLHVMGGMSLPFGPSGNRNSAG
jgi:hypothetical protein